MRRLERPQAPTEYTESVADFVRDYPPATPGRTESKRWKIWKNECQAAYAAVIDCLRENQGNLCAFCETTLTPTNREIEHFIPKSMTTAERDWTIDFPNYTLSCKGNTYRYDEASYSDDPSEAANYTCGHKKDNIDPTGRICNPYELPPYPVVRADFREDGLWFVPDATACQKAGISPELVASTLELLGLNCPSLLRRRKKAWNEVLKDMDDVFSQQPENQQQALQEVAENHIFPLHGELAAFYTTRLLCLASDLPELIQG